MMWAFSRSKKYFNKEAIFEAILNIKEEQILKLIYKKSKNRL